MFLFVLIYRTIKTEMIKMKKTALKRISLILSVLLLISCAALPVYAAEKKLDRIYVENTGQENGLVNYRYVDESGNEIVFEDNQLSCQAASIPSSYSSVDKGYVTPPKDQGDSGVCWSFSAMSLVESDSIIKGYTTLSQADYSEAHHAWFVGRSLAEDENDLAYGDGYAIDDPYNRGGNWRISAASLARWTGVATESEFPFYGGSLESMGNYDESDRYNNSGGVILESAVELSDAEDIKQWIIDHGSVTAAFYYDNSCYNSPTAAYCTATTDSINHQIVIVGWDDDFSASDFKSTCVPSGNGAWLCKNSWTTYWGDEGYFWISYYDSSISLFAGYSVQESGDYYKNYNYNGAEWYTGYQLSNALQVSNVFTASGYESLSAIAVQTCGATTEIEIDIYKNIASGYTSPIQGTAAYSASTVLEGTGYHTVYLDSAVSLEPGEIFSVVVRYYNPDGYTVIPVEGGDVEGLSFSSRDGESYINLSKTGNQWVTAASQGGHNFYIQAITKCNHQLATESADATCTENGSEKIHCTQCGSIEAERIINATGHDYGEWTDYTYSAEEGRRISTCTCANCGDCMKRGYYTSNVVTLDRLMEMLLIKFREVIRNIFTL